VEELVCTHCGSKDIVKTPEGYRCARCGEVLTTSLIDLGPEWREYTYEQHVARARAYPINPTRYQGGIRTTTISGRKDAHGRKLSPEELVRALHMQSMNTRLSPPRDRSLSSADAEISSAALRLGLPEPVRHEALRIVRIALDRDLARGRSIKLLVAAALYHASKKYGVPKTPAEIAEALGVRRDRMLSLYRLFHERGVITENITPSRCLDYIKGIVNRQGLGTKVIMVSKSILNGIEKTSIVQGKPARITAAAIVYIAAKLLGVKCERKELAKIARASDTTIRSRVKEILNSVDITIYI